MKKKNILFIFPFFPEDWNTSSLAKDLTLEFAKKHNVYVATTREKKYNLETEVQKYENMQILRVKTGNLFDNVNKFEKLFTTFTMPRKILSTIKSYWKDVKFDLIVTQTPYTSSEILINGLKRHYHCPSLLILFDLFPQNAKDIGLIRNNLIFNFFKYKEKKMLLSFDFIGCMSNGNINYVKKNYDFIDDDKLFLLPLWGSNDKNSKKISKNKIRNKYEIDENNFVLIFGGNLGKPQKIDNIVLLAKACMNDSAIKFLIVGKGTESQRIKQKIKALKVNNIIFIDYVPREDYENLTMASDIGLVSLDERFTVPNFPSKTIDYMRYGLPILASLDDCSANDYGKLIEQDLQCGLFCKAGDIKEFKNKLYNIKDDKKLYKKLSINSLIAFKNNFSVENTCQLIMEKFQNNFAK